jgi:DUF2889 family protein
LSNRALWPGTTGPLPSLPQRKNGSWRRTLTIDMLRPSGPDGLLVLDARARDLATGPEGERETSEVRAALDVAFHPDRLLVDVHTLPEVPQLRQLVGASTGQGFRAKAHAIFGSVPSAPPLLEGIFDEIPATTMLSRFSLVRSGIFAPRVATRPIEGVCAGFAPGTTLSRRVADDSQARPINNGPIATSWDDPHDPAAWHDTVPLVPGTMRRRRLHDVRLTKDDSPHIAVDSFFRDTFVEPDGTEAVIHEYGVVTRIRAADLVVTAMRATPHVLPAPECPGAAASAAACEGRTIVELEQFVRKELVGTRSCTHLSDHLRAVARLRPLVEQARAGVSSLS